MSLLISDLRVSMGFFVIFRNLRGTVVELVFVFGSIHDDKNIGLIGAADNDIRMVFEIFCNG